jgi:hypothetical protein
MIAYYEIGINNMCFDPKPQIPVRIEEIVVFTKLRDLERQNAVRENMERYNLTEGEDWNFQKYADGRKAFGPTCNF